MGSKMRPMNKGAWMMAAFAVLGVALAQGRAEAAGGIVIKTGVVQGGDPQFTNYIDIYLQNGTIPAYSAQGPVATVTLTGLTGVSSVDSYQFNDQYLPSPGESIGTPPLLSDANGGTASFQFFNTDAISATSQILLVEFVVITPPDTPQGLKPGDTFHYDWTIGTQAGSGSGTVVLGSPSLVPEPSSLVLMLVGGTVVPYFGLRYRRGRRSREAA